MSVLRGVAFIAACMYASKHMHDSLLLCILRAPLNTYFDVTPLGRILNKFSKDLDNMDSLLPDFFVNNLQNAFQCLFIFIVCITITPYILLILAPMMFVYYRFQAFFRKSSCELKRLDAMSRSPMYSLFSESLQGLITIRSYERQPQFIERFFALSDHQTRNFFVFYYSNRWLAIRFDLLSSLVLLSVALLATGIAYSTNRHLVYPNYLGLALVYSLQLTGLLQWTVRTATETETNMTSVERLLAFSTVKPEETDISNEDWIQMNKAIRGGDRGTPTESRRANVSWPSEGNIVITDLNLRYRPELDLVLKNLNIVIPGGKRIGICGRYALVIALLCFQLTPVFDVEQNWRWQEFFDARTVPNRSVGSRILCPH
jgi:ABC-type multidrug transport system fused ATPase/permease subunit